MARKTIKVSDQSGHEIPEGKGATVRIAFGDARKRVRELDLTDAEAEALGGRPVARRGRRPRAKLRPSAMAHPRHGEAAETPAIIRCVECCRPHQEGDHWHLYFADEGEVAIYCPECERREFGGG